MSELISTAPLYTKARVHLTRIGNILCTGKGCIGCDRKSQILKDHPDLLEILGEVDVVDFDKQEPRFLSSYDVFPQRGPKKLGRHGNSSSLTRTVGKNNKSKTGKIRKGRKIVTKPKGTALADHKSDSTMLNKGTPDSFGINNNKSAPKKQQTGSLKVNEKLNLRSKVSKNKTVSFSAPLTTERTFTPQPGAKRQNKASENNLSSYFAGAKQNVHHSIPRTYPPSTEGNTNFLKMLQSSDIGIFDVEYMKTKKSSKWVKEALKSGTKEEDIFPHILKKTQKGNNKKDPGNESRKERRESPKDGKSIREKVRALPRESPEGRLDDRGPNSGSVLVFEHSYHGVRKKDDSLHKLGFKAQHSLRTRSFPLVSILEIAESLDDLVQLGVVKFIHIDFENRWYIFVSGRVIRDFLIQSGVTLRGRHFELIDCIGQQEALF